MRNPDREIYYELGIVYRDSKMHTEAIVEFQKAIDVDPNFVAAHISLGKAYLEVRQLDAAENAAKAALRIDANSEPARELLDDIRQVRPPERAQSTDVPSQNARCAKTLRTWRSVPQQ